MLCRAVEQVVADAPPDPDDDALVDRTPVDRTPVDRPRVVS
jgi:hypothetical protein